MALEIDNRRTALGSDVAVRGAADVIAALGEQPISAPTLKPGTVELVTLKNARTSTPIGVFVIWNFEIMVAVIDWPSRDIDGIGTLLSRGLWPLTVVAVRVTPREAQKDIDCLALRPEGPEYPSGSLTSKPQARPRRQPDLTK